MTKFKTIEDFLEHLDSQDQTLAGWAKKQKMDLNVTYAVARGTAKGRRGNSRLVMRAMGLPLPSMRNQLKLQGATA